MKASPVSSGSAASYVGYTTSTGVPVGPVAGGSAVGSGLATSLFTATTSTVNTPVPVISTSTLRYSNGTMTGTSTVLVSKTITSSSSTATATLVAGEYTDWSSFKGNGVNLGNWLEQEYNLDPAFFLANAPNATDEWTFCEYLGSECGPVLEAKYASYITTAQIDKLAGVGEFLY